MNKRRVFLSFHYENDNWRARQIWNMGKFDSRSTFFNGKGEKEEELIMKWIDDRLIKCSCLIVLVGKDTYKRKWIKYEIEKAFNLNKGIVGIYIHKLKNEYGEIDDKGKNPFDNLIINGVELSRHIKCFDSEKRLSEDVYLEIKNYIEELIEYGENNKPKSWK